jgi:hypothetical protein
MNQMTQAASDLFGGHEFDDFLYAPVREEGNGMVLSVQSALARLNVDPREEAANLSRLPREAATRKLTTLIATLPGPQFTHNDPRSIAVRLIGLLPRPDVVGGTFRQTLSDPTTTVRSPILMFVIFMVLALSVQWIAANQQSATGVDQNRSAATPSTTIPGKAGG